MVPPSAPEGTPFATRAALRSWLAKNHAKQSELWIKFYKVGSGKKSIVNQEAVEEALCFGWIDGVVKSIDETAWKKRFTPRKPKSYWSAVNIRYAERLIGEGKMSAAGLRAFEARDKSAAARYSFENRPQELPAAALSQLKKNKAAFAFWQEQPASYRRTATWWVVSAKQDATRERRLATFIAHHAKGERIPQFVSAARKPAKRSAKK